MGASASCCAANAQMPGQVTADMVWSGDRAESSMTPVGVGTGTGLPQKVLVYLGASSPVSATHFRMAKALLGESGVDKVFVFLLRWRPERFGISADSGAEQLRKWCRALPPEDVARLELKAPQIAALTVAPFLDEP
jgi:hypothetical protein